jgi:hypothetical protein
MMYSGRFHRPEMTEDTPFYSRALRRDPISSLMNLGNGENRAELYLDSLHEPPHIPSKWEHAILKCKIRCQGREYLGNLNNLRQIFFEKYLSATVRWEGFSLQDRQIIRFLALNGEAENSNIVLPAELAAELSLGLCADCTSLEYDGTDIYMYRPALSGSVIAKIKSLTAPTLATVRTAEKESSDMTVAVGYGARGSLERVKALADSYGAALASSRRMTDSALMPYENQVGLTGRTVAPAVYLAIGISGAVHHIVGMERSGTVIAINPDKNAPIFEYADYGILEEF